MVRLPGLYRYEQYLFPKVFLGSSGPRNGHCCCAGFPPTASVSLTEGFVTLPPISSWKLRTEDSHFGNCRYYVACKESVHDHAFSNPNVQGEGLSMPGFWHRPVFPLPGSPAETSPLPRRYPALCGASASGYRHPAVAVRLSSLYFAQKLTLSIAGLVFFLLLH